MSTFEFKLPDVGEGLHEAEVTRWLVKVGDVVREDQPIVEVQTDKVSVELPSPVKGRITALHGAEGDTVKVGSVIAVFETDAGAAAPAAPVTASAPEAVPETVSAPIAAPAPPPAVPPRPPAVAAATTAVAVTTTHALATPSTRRTARELGIDINLVPGTGAGGRVTSEDVQRFAASAQDGAAAVPAAPVTPAPAAVPAVAPPPPALPGQRLPLRGIRKRIAERMVAAKHTAAHVTVVDEFDATDLVALREQARALAAAKGIKLSYLPFVVKALVAALKEFPYLNASIDELRQEVILHKEYNIGIAVDTDAGLLVPVIKGADHKTILQLAHELSALADKARAGKLALEEVQGGTCSISNMGSVGAGLLFTPVINVPEVAILGVGKLQDRPIVRDGQVVVRKMQYLSLSFDHRLVDGALATRFLARVLQLLGNPTLLFMEMM